MASKKSYLLDMDGVLVRGHTPIPGAAEFLARLEAAGAKFLVLTNNPIYTPTDLCHRLRIRGLNIPRERVFTSAMATARFLRSQRPDGTTAFVIGESGLTEPLHDAGVVITDHSPEYVILGETKRYDFDQITSAIRHLVAGAYFLATNPDNSGPSEDGITPACGAMAALIAKASGVEPFFIGKPNPLMMRSALNYLGVHSEDTIMVGDRMDTDVIGGLESGMDTILCLSGVTSREDIRKFSFHPTRVVESVAEIEP